MAFDWFASLPNFITIGRLVLTPAAITFVGEEKWRLALLVFVIAGVSDALDGWLAKTFHLQSDLGAVLDPLADKVLIVSMYVALAVVDDLPPWLAILVVARDALIIGGVLVSWFLSRPVEIRPHVLSKATTAAQLAFVGLILAGLAYDLELGVAGDVLAASVAALTVASASVYLWLWVEHMRP
ncbi:MAG: CDP-alcohol phosphatidyltransferase [Methylocystis sp.]|nr:MAG: CDP-alcohol phosphatidyltransferase [Methylocystis sp.]